MYKSNQVETEFCSLLNPKERECITVVVAPLPTDGRRKVLGGGPFDFVLCVLEILSCRRWDSSSPENWARSWGALYAVTVPHHLF
jgi:hypothetical protein